MKQPIPTLVIIDPYQAKAETDAINTIFRIAYSTSQAMQKTFAVQVLTPAHAQVGTHLKLHEILPIGIISLGSLANVTDNHCWFPNFEHMIRSWVFSQRIPLLGICFTHQYIARMLGARVSFLERRHEIKYGRFDGGRSFELLHPKLRLLFANLENEDLGTENKADLDFKEALRFSRSLDKVGWDIIRTVPTQRLHPQEARMRQFLEKHCPMSAYFAVAHEQEVLDLPSDLVVAAASNDCKYEAFISENQELVTFQSHPEYNVNLPDGKRLIRNFIYSLGI